eukprot:TRINITY_DN2256_c0_g3_i1.p1 TRINITY_DN2256_c0_g3~~TRINITY_DN2256_c0_g3_i1.p1  ORF type:complete len:193 (-),score=14.61 TRINITY_DN2256_c0_g3_i1:569-1147(-)
MYFVVPLHFKSPACHTCTTMARSRSASSTLFLLVTVLLLVQEATAFRHILGFYLHFTNSKSVLSRVVDGGEDPSPFGQGVVFDYPMTQMAGITTTALGVARGFSVHSSTDSSDDSSQEVATLSFTKYSQYSGSTLSVSGIWYSKTSDGIRELPVVGGTGFFRFASGYAVFEPLEDPDMETYFVRIELKLPDL